MYTQLAVSSSVLCTIVSNKRLRLVLLASPHRCWAGSSSFEGMRCSLLRFSVNGTAVIGYETLMDCQIRVPPDPNVGRRLAEIRLEV